MIEDSLDHVGGLDARADSKLAAAAATTRRAHDIALTGLFDGKVGDGGAYRWGPLDTLGELMLDLATRPIVYAPG